MPRKPASRSLAPLGEVFPEFRGFPPSDNASQCLLDLLRSFLRQRRSQEEAPFYSVREMGRFFGVPYKTAQLAYKKLEAEGLLRIVRGSQTLVCGRRLQPRHRILGVIGLAIFEPGFLGSASWRAFYQLLEEELRRRHFVANFILYSSEEEHAPDLAERLLMHQVDVLFWLAPPAWVRQTIQRLGDDGVPVVVCSDGKAKFSEGQYRLDAEASHLEAYALWKSEGIRAVEVWQSVPPEQSSFEARLTLRAAKERGIPPKVRVLLRDDFQRAVALLRQDPTTGIALPSHEDYWHWALRHTPAMEDLLRSHRVLLGQNPLRHPAFQGRDLYADVCHDFDPVPMAQRIASDIVRPATWRHTKPLATFFNRFTPGMKQGSPEDNPYG